MASFINILILLNIILAKQQLKKLINFASQIKLKISGRGDQNIINYNYNCETTFQVYVNGNCLVYYVCYKCSDRRSD